jgi:hypothetical protein
MAVIGKIVLAVLTAWAVMFMAFTLLLAFVRVLVLSPILCPRCKLRFGRRSAIIAKRVTCHIQWLADYRPKLGETDDCIYRIRCSNCFSGFVYNLRRTRMDAFESDHVQ